jgi:poly(3-hydroxybutyrate) depolymerase
MEVPGAGHYGIFAGRRWRDVVYPEVKSFILKHQPKAKPVAAVVVSAPTAPEARLVAPVAVVVAVAPAAAEVKMAAAAPAVQAIKVAAVEVKTTMAPSAKVQTTSAPTQVSAPTLGKRKK